MKTKDRFNLIANTWTADMIEEQTWVCEEFLESRDYYRKKHKLIQADDSLDKAVKKELEMLKKALKERRIVEAI